jgi:hypothetical protein
MEIFEIHDYETVVIGRIAVLETCQYGCAKCIGRVATMGDGIIDWQWKYIQ